VIGFRIPEQGAAGNDLVVEERVAVVARVDVAQETVGWLEVETRAGAGIATIE
jgi:hypothetical protein